MGNAQDKLDNQIFELRFQAKQMNRAAAKKRGRIQGVQNED